MEKTSPKERHIELGELYPPEKPGRVASILGHVLLAIACEFLCLRQYEPAEPEERKDG